MILIRAKFERDKSLKTKMNLVFSTKEEISEIELAQLEQGEGFLAFNPDEYRAKVLRIIEAKRIGVDEGEMSNSQKLRFVLWNVAQARGLEFEEFYTSEIDRICDHYKIKYL
jgi:hypothetical protein